MRGCGALENGSPHGAASPFSGGKENRSPNPGMKSLCRDMPEHLGENGGGGGMSVDGKVGDRPGTWDCRRIASQAPPRPKPRANTQSKTLEGCAPGNGRGSYFAVLSSTEARTARSSSTSTGFARHLFTPASKKPFLVPLHGVGGQRHDRQAGHVGKLGRGPNGPNGLNPVQNRHLDIQKGRVHALHAQEIKGLDPVFPHTGPRTRTWPVSVQERPGFPGRPQQRESSARPMDPRLPHGAWFLKGAVFLHLAKRNAQIKRRPLSHLAGHGHGSRS